MTATLNVLANLDGAGAQDGLIADPNGDLLGTTYSGGASGQGTVFEISKNAVGYSAHPITLISFNPADGSNPTSGLIANAQGDLFGSTQGSPFDGEGTVFEIAKTAIGYASIPTTLANFSGTDGSFLQGNLLADAKGDLFGAAASGGPLDANGTRAAGTIFEIAKTATGYASNPITLASFNGTSGSNPSGDLIADANGDLFGTTQQGGVGSSSFAGDGTVFEIATTTTGYTINPITLVSFDGLDGSNPSGGLIADANGNLFGTTAGSATNHFDGTVFEITKTAMGYASTPTALTTFIDTSSSGLIMDANGDLFGTTGGGGTNGDGTVFEIAKTAAGYASTPTTLTNFNGTNGSSPSGSLIADSDGNLFGTALNGGTSDDGTAFEITDSGFTEPLCFLAGTMIATPGGETRVQDLAVGDMVLTLSGRARHVIWIGLGRVWAAHGKRTAATPVCVHKSALADNVPRRNLRVSKAHGIYIDSVLIPVEFLINHRSILWDDRAQEVLLYHVELETHDILLANGAPAESYRDDGNRWLFQNANSGWGLPPQEPCVPVLTGGPLLDTVWRRLLERAGPRPGVPMTDDPDLHLVVNGRRIASVSRSVVSYVFRLAAPPETVRIVSRAGVPAELGFARDPRSLGVPLRQVRVSQGVRDRTIDASDTTLTKGFHGFEMDNSIRWTDGNATIPKGVFEGFDGPLEIELRLNGKTSYPRLHRASRVRQAPLHRGGL